ncbi:MAG: hypothetical protein QOF17_483 [Solirubrobacteraceae bacterium]|jgi:uncharacterized circularly permuted ATP-grasp superfamily protein|nr:hypothetical protein [Solirubrobacteraceae bacterium]
MTGTTQDTQDDEPFAEAGHRLVAGRDLAELADAVADDVAAVRFRSADGDERFHVDAVPRIIDAGDWAGVERGLAQRVRALNAFVGDVYGERRIVAEGVVPARVIDGAAGHQPEMRGLRPANDVWIGIAGLDLVREPSGRFVVLEDNTTTPSGFGYAAAARRAVGGQLDAADDAGLRDIDELPELLAGTLHAVRPEGATGLAVVLTDGPRNSAYWEHAWAAWAIGVPLVTPGQLRSDGERLWVGDRQVAAVYRRTDADRVDTGVGELLHGPLRAGTLGVVNGFGTAVADDKLSHAYVAEMVRFYLGEEPLLESVPTFDLGDPERLEEVLDRLDEMVVKPRDGHGGRGVTLGPHASPAELDDVRRDLAAEPTRYIAQPLVLLSTHSTVIGGELRQRHVDLRPFVFLHEGGRARVLPGGLTRVALEAGAMVVNSTRNGGAKDTWVLEAGARHR